MDKWAALENTFKKARGERASAAKANGMEKAEEGPYTGEGVPINWDGKNWRNYKYVVEIVLKRQNLWDIATGAIERGSLASAEEQAEFDRKNLDIQRILATSMTQEMLEQFLGCTTGRDFWKALCEKYENETVKMHAIRRLTKELWSAKFQPHENLEVHLQRMRNVCRELRNYEHRIDDDLLVELMLESLPSTKEFNSLKDSVYYNSDRAIDIDILEELIKYAHLQPDAEEGPGHIKHGFSTQGHGSGSQEAEKVIHAPNGNVEIKDKHQDGGCFECGGDHFKKDCPTLDGK